jgi:hypothetical protein
VLIGLTGTIGVGKNTVGEMLATLTDATVLGFADELKDDVHRWVASRISRPLTAAEIATFKGTGLGPIYQGYGEVMRQMAGFDYWIRRLALTLPERAIIADVRYENEAHWIKQRGGLLVSVIGPNRRVGDTRSGTHPSEAEVAACHNLADFGILNHGSLDDLRPFVLDAASLAFEREMAHRRGVRP